MTRPKFIGFFSWFTTSGGNPLVPPFCGSGVAGEAPVAFGDVGFLAPAQPLAFVQRGASYTPPDVISPPAPMTHRATLTGFSGATAQTAVNSRQAIPTGATGVSATARMVSIGLKWRVGIRFYDASNSQVGSDVWSTASDANVWDWSRANVSVASAAFPANATQAAVLVDFNGAVVPVSINGGSHSAFLCAVAMDWTPYFIDTDLMYGYIDSYEQKFDGFDSLVEVPFHDAFKVFAERKVNNTRYRDMILADGPLGYWRLGEKTSSYVYNEATGTNDGLYHGQLTQGITSGPLVTDADTATDFGAYTGWADLGYTVANQVFPGKGAWSIEAWVYVRSFSSVGGDRFFELGTLSGPGAGSYIALYLVDISYPNNTLGFQLSGSDGTVIGGRATTAYSKGAWHHVVIVHGAGQSYQTPTIYVDGVSSGFSSAGFATGDGCPTQAYNNRILLAGANDGPGADVMLDEVAVYGTPLTAAQVLAHYQAGIQAGIGNSSGQRIAAMLDTVPWIPAPTVYNALTGAVRNIDTGDTTLASITSSLADQNLLEYMQKIADTEDGHLFVNASGQVRFIGRRNFLRTPQATPRVTFGNFPGEVPFTAFKPNNGDDILISEVQAGRDNGATIVVKDEPAKAKFFTRTLALDGLLNADDADTEALAYYKLATFKNPQEYIDTLVLDWNMSAECFYWAMSLEIADRVTVHYRLPSGGLFDKDEIVIGVEHHSKKQSGQTTLSLAPADMFSYLLMDDPIKGKLDLNRVGY